MSNILDEILVYKRTEIKLRAADVPLEIIQAQATKARRPRDFKAALHAPHISLIAEVKCKSPSKGVLRENFDALDLARIYAANGARAISVLADEHFFGGSPALVQRLANAEGVDVPVLFKDFILTTYQIYEARAMGADAVLLIVRALGRDRLEQLLALTHLLGMQTLVEVFHPEEARLALAAGATIIGINNRDLQSFKVDLEQSEKIRHLIPTGVLTVSESGLHSRADVLRVEQAGFDGMLVGEALVKAPDIAAQVREFLGTLTKVG